MQKVAHLFTKINVDIGGQAFCLILPQIKIYMKTFNTVLGIILLVAVAYLFIHEFSGSTAQPNSDKPVNEALTNPEYQGARIAYINRDTLVENYSLHKKLKSQLEEKAKKVEADLANKSRVFQGNVSALQQQAPKLSQDELQAAQMDLQQTQQQLQMYADNKTRELQQEEQKLDSLIMADMDTVLENVRQENNLDFIMSYSRNSSVLTAKKDYDITNMVLKRLNENYAKSQEKNDKK